MMVFFLEAIALAGLIQGMRGESNKEALMGEEKDQQGAMRGLGQWHAQEMDQDSDHENDYIYQDVMTCPGPINGLFRIVYLRPLPEQVRNSPGSHPSSNYNSAGNTTWQGVPMGAANFVCNRIGMFLAPLTKMDFGYVLTALQLCLPDAIGAWVNPQAVPNNLRCLFLATDTAIVYEGQVCLRGYLPVVCMNRSLRIISSTMTTESMTSSAISTTTATEILASTTEYLATVTTSEYTTCTYRTTQVLAHNHHRQPNVPGNCIAPDCHCEQHQPPLHAHRHLRPRASEKAVEETLVMGDMMGNQNVVGPFSLCPFTQDSYAVVHYNQSIDPNYPTYEWSTDLRYEACSLFNMSLVNVTQPGLDIYLLPLYARCGSGYTALGKVYQFPSLCALGQPDQARIYLQDPSSIAVPPGDGGVIFEETMKQGLRNCYQNSLVLCKLPPPITTISTLPVVSVTIPYTDTFYTTTTCTSTTIVTTVSGTTTAFTTAYLGIHTSSATLTQTVTRRTLTRVTTSNTLSCHRHHCRG